MRWLALPNLPPKRDTWSISLTKKGKFEILEKDVHHSENHTSEIRTQFDEKLIEKRANYIPKPGGFGQICA
jgi:hypothetical protein